MAEARSCNTMGMLTGSDMDSNNGAGTDSMFNMLEVPWYHPNLTRHQAEAELANCDEGIYLLRPSGHTAASFSLDVKCAHSVKHFKINMTKHKIVFGQEIFHDLQSFLSHFDNCPLIGDETGHLNILKYPYPRDIDEIHDYQLVTEHFLSSDERRRSNPPQTQACSLVSKEGYLIKMGAIVKSWKKRWFVLKNNKLQYYTKDTDKVPIRSIDLQECTEVAPTQIVDRCHVFRVVVPERTFYLQAPNAEVMKDWITLLQWKMRELIGDSESTCKSRSFST